MISSVTFFSFSLMGFLLSFPSAVWYIGGGGGILNVSDLLNVDLPKNEAEALAELTTGAVLREMQRKEKRRSFWRDFLFLVIGGAVGWCFNHLVEIVALFRVGR